jgi:hypothetical protein
MPLDLASAFVARILRPHVTEMPQGQRRRREGTTFRAQSLEGRPSQTSRFGRRDYDRVIALAKGTYNSTSVHFSRSPSFLARVYKVKDDVENTQILRTSDASLHKPKSASLDYLSY